MKELLEEYAKKDVCLAFSGGIDSSLLLYLSQEAAKKQGTKLYAVTFDTVLHPPCDKETAARVAREAGADHRYLFVDELKQEEIQSNPKNRCYLCKKLLFGELKALAERLGAGFILEGTNQEDLGQYRPGILAVRELGIQSPLMEAGFTKAEVRQYARELGITVAERPSAPCLATRLPYGDKIDLALLKRIGRVEEKLREKGFYNVRARVHGKILRLEVDEEDFGRVLKEKEELLLILKEAGVLYVTLDLEGFRSGSMDAAE